VNQLSPVGHGAPLRDLIAAGLPYGELKEIRRNSGRIVNACHGIADKHVFEPSPKLDLTAESPENLLHLERADPEKQIETLKAMLDKFRNGARIGPASMMLPVDPVWDVMPIVPVNEKSPLARVTLNRILQGFLNPGGEQIKESPFRVGDRIINGKNGWLPVETYIPRGLAGGPWNQNQKEGKEYSANGEAGKVLALFPRYTVAQLLCPDRIIRIPKGDSYINEDGETQDTGCQWELGYAVSCHKSQGAQWPVVITMADAYPGARMLCTREWWYTALSRAETLAVTIGQRDVIQSAIQKSGMWSRKTFLQEQILELSQAAIVQGWEAALT
jgi:ATP-dependent exoDNAse (exonuclease V) alpha subunit